jgi:asparagine synthase (glutamine-hydrolysing)
VCGIVGVFRSKNTPSLTSELIRAMTHVLKPRGPDDSQIFLKDPIGFGHTRLKIIDGVLGRQPMQDEHYQVILVFNGEIYNYQLLRKELIQQGYAFKTESDTEVILASWIIWKESCVDHLEGMFAFALYDFVSQELFLARDRLGVKPLYYSFLDAGGVAFSSEIKALMIHPLIKKQLDTTAVIDYLSLGYIPDPKTPYQNVRQLNPGHCLLVNAQGKSRCWRYWDVEFNTSHFIDIQTALTTFEHLFDQAVSKRLQAEVPIGAFLSGGLDSSAVVLQMANHCESFNLYSAGFEDALYNELPYAKQVSNLFNLPHYTYSVLPSRLFSPSKMIDVYDEPFSDSSAIPTLAISQYAAERNKVVLSGDGGDEMLAGYKRYQSHLSEQTFKNRIPKWIPEAGYQWLAKHYPHHDKMPRWSRLQPFFYLMSMDPIAYYMNSISVFKKEELNQLLHPDFQRKHADYRTVDLFYAHQKRSQCHDLLSLLQYLDIKTYLPGDILKKVDRASMHYGLEVRSPFLDHQLVTWLANLPADIKINQKESKYLLKQWLEPKLTKRFVHRKKQGFSVPLAKWLCKLYEPELRALPERLRYYEMINTQYVQDLVTAHLSNATDFSHKLWSLLIFDAFLEKHDKHIGKHHENLTRARSQSA